MFAPVLKPQSPYRNSFSGLIWYLRQKVHPRQYLDRGGTPQAASSNMSDGLMELAMEENDERKDRDVRAIQWLIHNRTEDDEMESFVMAIPGSFTSNWGIDVWRNVSGVKNDEDTHFGLDGLTIRSQSDADLSVSIRPHHRSSLFQRTCHPLGLLHRISRIIEIPVANGNPGDVTAIQSIAPLPSDIQAPDDPYTHRALAIYELCKRVRHLVSTCDNCSTFANKELWLKRARGCIETAASLVVCADVKPELFGDLKLLLRPFYQSVDYKHFTAPGSPDGLFSVRLDCLSFAIVYHWMENSDMIKLDASLAIKALSRFGMEDDSEQTTNSSDDEGALRNARRIDENFEAAREFCVYGLRAAFRPSGEGTTEELVREVLARYHVDDISILERIALAVDDLANIDRVISRVNVLIHDFSGGLIEYVRGAHFDKFEQTIRPIRFFNHPNVAKPIFFPQFIFLGQRLRLLCSYSSKLHNIIDGEGNGAYQEILKSLETLWNEADTRGKWSGVRRRHLMERQLWRLQDFRDSGGFGFWIELFFLVIRQLSMMSLSPHARTSFIGGTFRIITFNWRQYKHSIGTQRVILNLVCDIAILNRGIMSNSVLPRFITDELLVLLENMVDGQSGSHVDDAMKELEDAINDQNAIPGSEWSEVRLFRAEAVKVLSRLQAPMPFL